MSTDQILFGVGLIVVLAVGSQVLASRLRIPALIILLPAGFSRRSKIGGTSPTSMSGIRSACRNRVATHLFVYLCFRHLIAIW